MSATAWLEQAAKNFRAGSATLEQEHRATLDANGRRTLDEFSALMSARLEEFRKAGEAVAEPLEARTERMQKLLEDCLPEADHAVTHARQDLLSAVEKASEQLRDTAAARVAQITDAETATRKRLQQAGEAMLAGAHERASPRWIKAPSIYKRWAPNCISQAAKHRQEDWKRNSPAAGDVRQSQAGLDKLVETLETGRATLRDGLELLRVNQQQHQARLQSFTSDQEATLRARTAEMEQRLAAAMLRMETELREQATAALETAHQGFVTRIEQRRPRNRKRFAESAGPRPAGCRRRLPRIAAGVGSHPDRAFPEPGRGLVGTSASPDAHSENIEQQGREATARLREQREQGEQAMQQALTAALAAVEDRQAAACTAVGEQLKEIQQQREAAARQHSAQEQMVQKWRLGPGDGVFDALRQVG